MIEAKKGRGRPLFPLVVAAAAVLLCIGCRVGEPDNLVRKKLDVIVAADLKALVDGLPATSLRDSTYSVVVGYTTYKEGMYSVRAVIDFYYLRGVAVKRTVKYRYLTRARKWERYDNEFRFYSDSAAQ
jgi:hypothetical protein